MSELAQKTLALYSKISEVVSQPTLRSEKLSSIVSLESSDEATRQLLENTVKNIKANLASILGDVDFACEDYQVESGSKIALVSTNPIKFLTNDINKSIPSNVGMVVMPTTSTEPCYQKRPFALEAYDERENRNAQLYSIMYNLLASRQDDFGETLFPTLVVNPNEFGIKVAVRIFYTYNDFRRSLEGDLANYNRRNIVRAYADPDVLRNELTRAVPVIRDAPDNSARFFVQGVAPWTGWTWTEDLGVGVTVDTAYVRVNDEVDWIGISQTDQLIESGLAGPTDNLDPYLVLSSVLIRFSDGNTPATYRYVRVDTSSLPDSTFVYSPQDNYRRMNLNLDNDSLVLMGNAPSFGVAGNLTDLGATSANRAYRFRLTLSGLAILDTGRVRINGGSGALRLVSVYDTTTNTQVPPTAAEQAQFNDRAEVVGYTLTAYRANSNLRQRGQLLDTQVYYRLYYIPYRSPLAVLAPTIGTAEDDTSAITTLVTATGIRVSNAAVSTLLRADQVLSSYLPVPFGGNLPRTETIGDWYVIPTHITETLDFSLTVDSLRSQDRIKDIASAIVEKVRYVANELYRRSEYKAAADVLTGNTGFVPTVIVATDPVIHNYIMQYGDLRTLGEGFNVKVVSTLNKLMRDKIFVTFGVFDSSRNTTINPLNFGNMLWSPELVVTMPIARDGQISKELIVAPRFLHIVNLPVLGRIDVENLPAVIDKVTVYNST